MWAARLASDIVLITYGPHARQTFVVDGRGVSLDNIAAEPYVALIEHTPARGIWTLKEQAADNGENKITATGPRRGCLRHGVAIALARRFVGI